MSYLKNMALDKLYLMIFFSLNFARTIPHAVLLVMLVEEKQITIEIYSIMQIMFSCALLIFEVPSGILSDKYGRKQIFIVAIILLLITCVNTYFLKSSFMLILSWFIYGMSSAMFSGTIDAQVVKSFNNDENKINNFTKRESLVESSSAIIGATLGSLLYVKIGIDIYLISIVFLVISLILATVYIKIEAFKGDELLTKFNLPSVKIINKKLLFYLLLICSLSIIIQPIFLYWQGLYLNRGFNTQLFFIVYILMNFAMLIGAKIKFNFSFLKVLFTSILILITYIIVSYSNDFIFFIGFCSLLIFYSVLNIDFKSRFRNAISSKSENISFLISLSSSLARIFSILIIIFATFLINNYSISLMYAIIFLTFIIVLLIIYAFKFVFKIK